MVQIKQLTAKDVWEEIQQNPNVVLVDVRTIEELENIGMPDESLFKARYVHLPIALGAERQFNTHFEKDFENVIEDKNNPIALICAAGARSQSAAELILKLGYKDVINISDGFSGNASSGGWQASGLPWEKLKK